MEGQDEILRAALGPMDRAHPRAAATFLEGLARWHRRPLTVALSVDGQDSSSASLLCIGLEEDQDLHYRVVVVPHACGCRGERLSGLGHRFGDLRRLALAGALL